MSKKNIVIIIISIIIIIALTVIVVVINKDSESNKEISNIETPQYIEEINNNKYNTSPKLTEVKEFNKLGIKISDIDLRQENGKNCLTGEVINTTNEYMKRKKVTFVFWDVNEKELGRVVYTLPEMSEHGGGRIEIYTDEDIVTANNFTVE